MMYQISFGVNNPQAMTDFFEDLRDLIDAKEETIQRFQAAMERLEAGQGLKSEARLKSDPTQHVMVTVHRKSYYYSDDELEVQIEGI